MRMAVLLVASKLLIVAKAGHAAAAKAHTSLQWSTLAWIVGAAVAATVIIAVVVIVSRRPKSMEDGIAEFSRSLQAVAPTHRLAARAGHAHPRPGPGKAPDDGTVRATRGRTETV